MDTPTIHEPTRQLRFAGLWRHTDFRRLWAAQSVSEFGSTLTREALPYTAILVLNATPIQMGLLGAAGSAPLLIFGLLAGVWVDRLRRRPVMIAADLIRAVLLLSIPLAYFFGVLRIGQLFVVAALAGIFTVLFDTAYHSYLPTLIERRHLLEGNSKLGMTSSVAEISGPPLGGALVQLVSGPITLLIDALSFLFSAGMLARIRAEEPPAECRRKEGQPAERPHVWRDVTSGLRAIWASRLLRPMAISSLVQNFFGWFFGAIYGLYGLRVLGLTPIELGITVATGGIGSFLGALLVGRITRRFGVGPAIAGVTLVAAASSSCIWLAGSAPWAAMPLLIAGQVIGDMGQTAAMINLTSLRQTITSDGMLGRVNASMNVMGKGIGTLGLLVGGVLAELIGIRATVAVAIIGGVTGDLLLVFSPLRRVRNLEE